MTTADRTDVTRLAPTPLYNTEEDAEAAARHLNLVLGRLTRQARL